MTNCTASRMLGVRTGQRQFWSAVACHRFGWAKQAEPSGYPLSQATVIGEAKAVASHRTPKCSLRGWVALWVILIRNQTLPPPARQHVIQWMPSGCGPGFAGGVLPCL
jgi:hypothetical protein